MHKNGTLSVQASAQEMTGKEMLYDAMILPLFDYCSAVWDKCGKTNCDFLEKLQRRAASIIEGRRVLQSDVNLTKLAIFTISKGVSNLSPSL